MFWVHPVLTLSVKNVQLMLVCVVGTPCSNLVYKECAVDVVCVLGTPCTNLVCEKCAVDDGLCFGYTLY